MHNLGTTSSFVSLSPKTELLRDAGAAAVLCKSISCRPGSAVRLGHRLLRAVPHSSCFPYVARFTFEFSSR